MVKQKKTKENIGAYCINCMVERDIEVYNTEHNDKDHELIKEGLCLKCGNVITKIVATHE